jgi:hypothetical protein
VTRAVDRAACVGRPVRIEPNDLLAQETRAEVMAVSVEQNAIALRLARPLTFRDTLHSHAVAGVRYEGDSIATLCDGRPLICNVTWVPDSRFKPDAPCDVSWWRGGAAAIATVFPAWRRSPGQWLAHGLARGLAWSRAARRRARERAVAQLSPHGIC